MSERQDKRGNIGELERQGKGGGLTRNQRSNAQIRVIVRWSGLTLGGGLFPPESDAACLALVVKAAIEQVGGAAAFGIA